MKPALILKPHKAGMQMKCLRVCVPGNSVHVLHTATPSLAEAPVLDPGMAHEYSDSKIPAFRNQMS